jgi:hypothetical protein
MGDHTAFRLQQGKGSFVITHANAATTRTISYAFRNSGG